MLARVCVSEARRLIACAVLSTMTPTGHVLSVVMETRYAAAVEGVLVSNGFEGLSQSITCTRGSCKRLVNVISPDSKQH